MKFLYTDIDYVLSLGSEINPKQTKWGLVHRMNKKAVDVYNDILLETGAFPIISSDWRNEYTLQELQEIFTEMANIIIAPIDVTPFLHGATPLTLNEFRAKEIIKHVLANHPENWVAIDDMNLSEWIDEKHFVHLPRFMEGVKQTGKKQEIIKKLNI